MLNGICFSLSDLLHSVLQPLWPHLTLIASLVAQRLKCLPPMQETRVRSLGREDPLEKEMVTHFSILAWRIPWTEKLGGLQSTGSQRVWHNRATAPPPPPYRQASQVAQWYRIHLPMQETWVHSLGWEDPLEKRMVTHFSILAWEIPWTEVSSGLQPMGSQRVRHDWVTSLTPSLIYTIDNWYSSLYC